MVRADDLLVGVRVVRIERKRVVVNNCGKLEAITLDEESARGAAQRASKSAPSMRQRNPRYSWSRRGKAASLVGKVR